MSNLSAIDPLRATNEKLDDILSQRFIELDPNGYFIIQIDSQKGEIIVSHYDNTVDESGLARDPDTGDILRCSESNKKNATVDIRGRTAKEVGIKITEGTSPLPLKNDHALYLGRELQKAEFCLINNMKYIQD